MCPVPDTDASSPTTARSASKETVIRGLLGGLFGGAWQGGDRITEAEACERFGISRTPVREALLELQGLGLVALRRNCGAIFLPFGPAELREIYAVRSLLEVEATRLATGRLDRSILDRLIAGFQRIRDGFDADPDWRLDRELHHAIARASGNRRLATEIDRYGGLVQAMRETVGARALGIHTTTAEDHLAILRAMRTCDAPAAAEAMRAHLAQAAESGAAAVEALRTARR